MISNTPGPFKASEVSIDLIGIWEERSVNSLLLQSVAQRKGTQYRGKFLVLPGCAYTFRHVLFFYLWHGKKCRSKAI